MIPPFSEIHCFSQITTKNLQRNVLDWKLYLPPTFEKKLWGLHPSRSSGAQAVWPSNDALDSEQTLAHVLVLVVILLLLQTAYVICGQPHTLVALGEVHLVHLALTGIGAQRTWWKGVLKALGHLCIYILYIKMRSIFFTVSWVYTCCKLIFSIL